MFITVCKKTVIGRALQRTLFSAAFLCLSAVPAPFDVFSAQAAESSLPQTMPDGGPNLTEAWMRNGGARLYWNTLTQPRQIRMEGAAFADPATVPELMPGPQGKTDGKSVAKGGRGTAPHSITIDPKAPVSPWPRGASRPAKKSAAAGQQAIIPAGQKPVSTSPALTAPVSSQGNGKTVPAAASAASPVSGKDTGRAPSGVPAATVNGQSGSPALSQPKASAGAGSNFAGVPTATAPNGGQAAAAPASSSAIAPSSPPPAVSLTGKGAGAAALSHATGPARQANGNSSADVPLPPPVPTLTADDLLPPTNGAGHGSISGGAAPAHAPLP